MNKLPQLDSSITKSISTHKITKPSLRLSQDRIKTFQDVSYLQKKKIETQSQSLVAQDPLLYQTKYINTKSSLYLSIYNMNRNNDLKETISRLNTRSIDIPMVSQMKFTQFQKYLGQVAVDNSRKLIDATPPNRQQVLDLQEWLERMIKNLRQDQSLNTKDLAESVQMIYSTCLQELIRQISIECKERGNLLQTVWTQYIEFIENILNSYIEEQQKVEFKHLQELSKIEQSYQNKINILNAEKQVQLKQIQDLEQANKDQQIKVSAQKKKIVQLFAELKWMNTQIEIQKEQLTNAMNELIAQKSEFETKENARLQKINIQEGHSIVSHLLNMKMIHFDQESSKPKIGKRQSLLLEEEQFKQELSDQEQIDIAVNQIRTGLITEDREIQCILENLDQETQKEEIQSILEKVDQETQTETIDSREPLINEILKQILGGEFVEYISPRYENALVSLKSLKSIPDSQKDELVNVLQTASLQLITIPKISTQISIMEQEQIHLMKKNKIQELEIKENQQQSEYYQDLLQDTAKEFVQILKKKKLKIKRLQKSMSQLQTDKQKLHEEPNSFRVSPKESTPGFKQEKKFNFQNLEDNECIVEDTVEEAVDENDSKELSKEQSKDVSFQGDISKDSINEPVTPSLLLKDKYSKLNQIITKFTLNTRQRPKLNRSSAQPINLLLEKSDKKVKRVFSQNTDQANQILKDVLKIKKSKHKILMSLTQVNKIINAVFQDSIKGQDGFKVPLQVGIYDYYIKRYGFKNVAERKIKQLFSFIVQSKTNNIKLTLIARMCYMEEQMDEVMYKNILQAQKYFQLKEIQFNKPEVLIPTEIVQEYSQEVLQKFLGQKYYQLFIVQLKQFKTISFDQLMQCVCQQYFNKKIEFQQTLKLIFQAADLDGNNLIQYSEFKNLNKAIHIKFEKEKALQDFMTYADFIDEETKDKMITLPRFTEMALDVGLFNPELIMNYAQNSNSIFEEWEKESDLIKYRFLKAEKFHQVKYTYNLLEKEIKNHKEKQETSHDLITLWVSYKLLNERSKRIILNYEIKGCLYDLLPLETLIIHETCKVSEELF